jgi:hypothetical protein
MAHQWCTAHPHTAQTGYSLPVVRASSQQSRRNGSVVWARFGVYLRCRSYAVPGLSAARSLAKTSRRAMNESVLAPTVLYCCILYEKLR